MVFHRHVTIKVSGGVKDIRLKGRASCTLFSPGFRHKEIYEFQLKTQKTGQEEIVQKILYDSYKVTGEEGRLPLCCFNA